MASKVEKSCVSIVYAIYMAGDISVAKQICRTNCFEVGLCVNITAVDYIYTGGEEAGFKVELINYPRFESTDNQLKVKTENLASQLMVGCCQNSYTIVGPTITTFYSRRKEETE